VSVAPSGPPRGRRFCASTELAEGQIKTAWFDDLPVAVARQAGALLAFGGLCPHQQADFSSGLLEDGGITCSHHLWHFELSTGRCTMMPGASIPIYLAYESEGSVWLDLTPRGPVRPGPA
jgi:nitrite reductase/ring-hydroxylating ferredoxin subunit